MRCAGWQRGQPGAGLLGRDDADRIVARAGEVGAVTIATNMAGRGTDIQLGGNADMRKAQELADIEDEAAHAVHDIGLGDRRRTFHRVHEMDRRLRDRGGILEFRQRGDIELADAGAMQGTDQEGRAVRLVGIGDFARKILQEPACGARGRVRTQCEHRIIRLMGLEIGLRGSVTIHGASVPKIC